MEKLNHSCKVSIIVCATKNDEISRLERNIMDTIGVPYEFMPIYNHANEPIAKIYNKGVTISTGEYLFFIHQDVSFMSNNWGRVLIDGLNMKKCGAIGFAGSKTFFDCVAGWCQRDEDVIMNYYHPSQAGNLDYIFRGEVSSSFFSKVVALDGFALGVKREVFLISPFDEKVLSGFHGYDIDFCLSLFHLGYQNFVCVDPSMKIIHFSNGSFNRDWAFETLRLYKLKWRNILPLSVENISEDADLIADELNYKFVKLFVLRFMSIKQYIEIYNMKHKSRKFSKELSYLINLLNCIRYKFFLRE